MLDELKNHSRIQVSEIIAMFLTAITIGFIMSFNSWDLENVFTGLFTLILLTIVAFSFLLIRTWSQKYIALKKGYLTSYTIHKYTLPVSFFFAFFSNGFIPFVSVGELKIQESKRLRLGTFRYGLNYIDLAIIGLAAPISMILLMIVIKPLFLATSNPYIHKIVLTAAVITFFGLLPIRGQEGFDIFFYRRWLYFLSLAFVIVYFVLILFTSVFSYVIAALIALGIAWIYKEFIN